MLYGKINSLGRSVLNESFLGVRPQFIRGPSGRVLSTRQVWSFLVARVNDMQATWLAHSLLPVVVHFNIQSSMTSHLKILADKTCLRIEYAATML
jgi:hypothetical protein